MAARSGEEPIRLLAKVIDSELVKSKNILAYLKRRATAHGCYYDRFPQWPDQPSQLEHIEAFVELLDDLKDKNGDSNAISELQRDLRAQMHKDDCGESEVRHCRSLADRIQCVIDATMSALRAKIA
ncbi:hypothetical protein FSPOR_2712 [Fusarium sporotrichioides]|uniref:Uncharacterized protein n=1 Tax=Fusarium sporotrichioides TaxID=5514 RepID=A0A395SJD6_FUSSP|nr:hypothetical protein FSPOR_2712 [Fusarium sporotrichioides]